MKKLFLLMLGILMAFPAFALEFEYTYEGQTLQYSTYYMPEGEVSVTHNYGISGDLKVPDYVLYNDMSYSVTEIGYRAFDWCVSLTSVTIPNSVTSIGKEAFHHCTSLTSVTIPNSVTSIGEMAFSSCGSLTSVTIPNSVTSIGEGSFAFCPNLIEISIAQDNSNYVLIDGVVINKDTTKIIACPGGKQGEYSIPSSVTEIGALAFSDCRSLTSVSIPNSVTSIGNSAFFGCTSLTSVTIPNSVTSIGNSAFSNCYSLTSVTIPNSVTSIGGDVFSYCGLTSVTIPESVTEIGPSAFSCCSELISISIPESVTRIGHDAFSYCTSLTSVTLPNSVTEIGESAFKACHNLREVFYNTEHPTIGSENIFYSENIFSSETDRIYKNATLYVPEVAVEKCRQIDPWKNFRNIQAYDFSNGVEDAVADFDADAPYEVYSLSGVKAADRLDGLAPGVYILRQGRAAKKVTVK